MSKDKLNFGQEDMNKDDVVEKKMEVEQDAQQTVQEESAHLQIDEDAETTALINRIVELEAALDASEKTVKEQQESVLYARSEVQTMRNRTEQEIDKAKKFALEKFAGELLPVIDNMERAIELADKENDAIKPMLEGIELTLKTMQSTVEKFGLKEINPVGEVFNPEFHQAMSIQESPDHASNTVTLVMQKGYLLNGRVVRPAMVMVAK